MRVITPKIFYSNRVDLAEYFPFTIIISSTQETLMVLVESLQLAGKYIIQFMKKVPIYLRNNRNTYKSINLYCIRTDGNKELIQDFNPIHLHWDIGQYTVDLAFQDLRISDGLRLNAYINKLNALRIE